MTLKMEGKMYEFFDFLKTFIFISILLFLSMLSQQTFLNFEIKTSEKILTIIGGGVILAIIYIFKYI